MKRTGHTQRRTVNNTTPAEHTLQDRAFTQAPTDQAQITKPSAHSFGSVPLHSAPIASTSNATPIIQRVVDPYKSGRNLASNSVALKGLNKQQREQMQQLHKEGTHYTIDEARQKAIQGQNIISPNQKMPPFPFRYDRTNQGEGHMGPISLSGGMVQYPLGGLPQREEDDISQISINSGSTYDSLTKTSKREITQSASMGYVSPNAAAEELGFECPTNRSWEWLHLAAFSLGVTHVPEISSKSRELVEKINQPQQIPENLVLGSAAANTAMLTYESELKLLMKKNPEWELKLWVNANTQEHQVDNTKGVEKSIRVASRIDYHFLFTKGSSQVIGPVVLAFNPMSHAKPTLHEYQTATEALQKATQNPTTVSNLPRGINTDGMVSFSQSGEINPTKKKTGNQQQIKDKDIFKHVNDYVNTLEDDDSDMEDDD